MLRGASGFAVDHPAGLLTTAELETVKLFGRGLTYAKIAEARGNSVVTVRNTLYRVQDKLGVANKQELVIWAVRKGLLDDVAVGQDPQTLQG